LVEQRRSKAGAYDCLVALSGGRDSTFAAYHVVHSLGLKPLLYTFDNGLMPDQTRENIESAVSLLGADLVMERSDHVIKNARHVLSCWMRKPSPAMIGLLCSGCRTGYVRGLARTAREFEIPLVITGGGEPERSFAQRLLSPTNSRGRKMELISGMIREWVHNPYYVADPQFVSRLAVEFFYRFLHSEKDAVNTVPLFRYIGWDEQTIVSTIEEKMQWKKAQYTNSTWRSDCKINELKNYLYLHSLGFTKHDELLSGMVRKGMMDRGTALRRLAEDNVISEPFLVALSNELGFDRRVLAQAVQESH
jgi:hypothetical protein